jgi:hypothetical protein
MGEWIHETLSAERCDALSLEALSASCRPQLPGVTSDACSWMSAWRRRTVQAGGNTG